ncbi:ATP12 family chaperone protein [Chelatococcus composti]|uniref:Chaperone required for assembly of F1-ATPase n=1 Tax=Chelatococcus composti TaxID=1743235 RepID=A0A841K555_9HYPH|nr:ATP12 family protein [Chelatococcus composti]MBB6166622.1 chaperone required for assembly of F1-ATPase [Chelatococcus composti]MBS7734449.1 ATPase [Chelatococcus composti]GGG26947.1 ATPase [Chelatococcus composti]
MRDELTIDWFPKEGEAVRDPMRAAQQSMKAHLPRRFYKEAAVEERAEGFVLLLDGRPARTPGKALLALPTQAAGEAVAAEWAAQGEHIDPAAMPLTRIANSAIDGVSREMEAVAADVVKYAGSDLLCYRAEGPERLVARQQQIWDPILAWVREALGARFVLAEGVMFVAQPEASLAAVAAAVARFDRPMALAALHVLTTLSGSALIALAVALDHLTPEAAWLAAHVDEDVQMEIWGEDQEALERRAARWREFAAAAQMLRALA